MKKHLEKTLHKYFRKFKNLYYATLELMQTEII
jgi:hypothetical protein